MTEPPQAVDLAVLRSAVGRVLGAYQAKYGDHVPLLLDHYWTLWPAVAFDMAAEPATGLTVGQLSE